MEPGKLPPGLVRLLEDPACPLLVGAASAWELATKWRIGQLPGATRMVRTCGRALDGLAASEPPISSRDALQVGLWKVEHAQAVAGGLGVRALDRHAAEADRAVAAGVGRFTCPLRRFMSSSRTTAMRSCVRTWPPTSPPCRGALTPSPTLPKP